MQVPNRKFLLPRGRVDNADFGVLSYLSMTQAITAIARNFLNIIYPLHCASCKTALDPLKISGVCSFCEGQIKRNPEECKAMNFYFDRAWSACLYEGVIKELIRLFKYKGRLALSGILCGQVTGFIKNNAEIINGIDIVTSVPLYKDRVNKREFNHSEILASAVSGEFHIPYSKVIEKKRRTGRQNELSRDERLTNLAGAFRVKRGALLGGTKILLIDDVMTTGATLNECAKTLKASGAVEVRCLTLARGILT